MQDSQNPNINAAPPIPQNPSSLPPQTPNPLPPQSPNPESPGTPVIPAPEKNKFNTKLAIIIGVIALVAVVIVVVLLLVLPGSKTLSCARTGQKMFGAIMDEQYSFRIDGSKIESTDYVLTSKPDPDSTIYSVTVDDLYDSLVDEIDGLSKASVNKRGDSVVFEANGLTQSELSDYTGLHVISTGNDDTRSQLKEYMEGKDYICK